MTRQRFTIEVFDDSDDITADDLSIVIEEALENHLPDDVRYLLTECEDEPES